MQTPHCTHRLMMCVNSLVHCQATSKSLTVHITRKLVWILLCLVKLQASLKAPQHVSQTNGLLISVACSVVRQVVTSREGSATGMTYERFVASVQSLMSLQVGSQAERLATHIAHFPPGFNLLLYSSSVTAVTNSPVTSGGL